MTEIVKVVFQLVAFGCCAGLAIVICEFCMYIIRAIGVWLGVLYDELEYDTDEE